MKFTELVIHTNTLGAELAGGIITAAGISCYSVEDPNDLRALLEDHTVPYDYIEEGLLEETGGETLVKVYISKDGQGFTQLQKIKHGIECIEGDMYGSLRIDEAEVDDADWADNWKQYFHPLKIGKRFLVKPTWEECEPEGREVLEIDPASSFGTGRHETTALCLKALENCAVSGEKVLDMGCGSGILAIGALKLGAESALLVDIDSVAAAIAQDNLKLNGVEGRASVLCGNVLDDAEFEKRVFGTEYGVILANIVADIIKGMAPMFLSSLKSGGTLICSGVIGGRREEVEAALAAAGFIHVRTDEENDWVVIVCTKK